MSDSLAKREYWDFLRDKEIPNIDNFINKINSGNKDNLSDGRTGIDQTILLFDIHGCEKLDYQEKIAKIKKKLKLPRKAHAPH